jgi:cell wall-associated NlpC family hydrolase
VASAVVVGLVAAVMLGHHTAPASGPASTTAAAGTVSGAPSPAAARAIAYARAQIGKPYLWGGTGPDAYDCSGLVMEAYASAGVSIPRTSETQWAAGPQVPPDQVEPGDLVFFAGGDGTDTAPGHVGLVIGGGQMIEAYATGFPVRISVYGQADSPAGDQDPVGFTDPAAGAGGSP